jgi:hypothetical protein
MIDPEVLKGSKVEHVVALPTVGIDDVVGHDLALHGRH